MDVCKENDNVSEEKKKSLRSYRLLNAEFITGWRLNSTLLFADGYLYSFNAKTKSMGDSWLCTELKGRTRACKVRVYLKNDECRQPLNPKKHNHKKKNKEKMQLEVLNKIKYRVRMDATLPVLDIWKQETAK